MKTTASVELQVISCFYLSSMLVINLDKHKNTCYWTKIGTYKICLKKCKSIV